MNKKLRDKKWSKAVNEKYRGVCPHCGKRAIGGAHHIIPRGCLKTRWLLENGIMTCNWLHRELEASAERREKVIHEYIGEKRYYLLECIADGIVENVRLKEIQ